MGGGLGAAQCDAPEALLTDSRTACNSAHRLVDRRGVLAGQGLLGERRQSPQDGDAVSTRVRRLVPRHEVGKVGEERCELDRDAVDLVRPGWLANPGEGVHATVRARPGDGADRRLVRERKREGGRRDGLGEEQEAHGGDELVASNTLLREGLGGGGHHVAHRRVRIDGVSVPPRLQGVRLVLGEERHPFLERGRRPLLGPKQPPVVREPVGGQVAVPVIGAEPPRQGRLEADRIGMGQAPGCLRVETVAVPGGAAC